MPTAQARGAKSDPKRRTAERPRSGEHAERDENYNLIAVLYRALREVERYTQYIEDAEESGNSELIEFFEENRETQTQLAERARKLLTQRMIEAGHDEDEGDEEDGED